MNNERAGEQVFANVDHALAGRIISRSRENSKEAKPVVDDNTVRPGIDNHQIPRGLMPVVKIAAVLLALLVLMKLVFGRKVKDRK